MSNGAAQGLYTYLLYIVLGGPIMLTGCSVITTSQKQELKPCENVPECPDQEAAAFSKRRLMQCIAAMPNAPFREAVSLCNEGLRLCRATNP